jgi:hypothetical protein
MEFTALFAAHADIAPGVRALLEPARDSGGRADRTVRRST